PDPSRSPQTASSPSTSSAPTTPQHQSRLPSTPASTPASEPAAAPVSAPRPTPCESQSRASAATPNTKSRRKFPPPPATIPAPQKSPAKTSETAAPRLPSPPFGPWTYVLDGLRSVERPDPILNRGTHSKRLRLRPHNQPD